MLLVQMARCPLRLRAAEAAARSDCRTVGRAIENAQRTVHLLGNLAGAVRQRQQLRLWSLIEIEELGKGERGNGRRRPMHDQSPAGQFHIVPGASVGCALCVVEDQQVALRHNANIADRAIRPNIRAICAHSLQNAQYPRVQHQCTLPPTVRRAAAALSAVAPQAEIFLLEFHFVAIGIIQRAPPDDALDILLRQECPQAGECTRLHIRQDGCAMWNEHVALDPLWVALHPGANQLIGAIGQRFASIRQRLSMPAVVWTIANGQPAGPVPGFGVRRLLRWLESRWWRLPLFGVVSLVELAVAYHTGGSVVLPGWHTLASNHPFRAGNDLVAHEAVALIIAGKQADDLFHWVGPFAFQIRHTSDYKAKEKRECRLTFAPVAC